MVTRDKLLYTSFAEAHKDVLPLFYWPEWLDTVCEGQWDALIYRENNVVISVFPFHFKYKYGLSAIISPILTPYGGDFHLANMANDVKSSIQLEFIKNLPKAFYYNLALHPMNTEKTGYEKGQFNFKTRFTHIIKNNDFDAVFDKFDSTVKSHIRKAEKSLKVIKDHDVDTLWQSLNHTFVRNKVYVPFDKSMIAKIQKNFGEKATIYHAVDELNNTHASVLTIEDNHTVYHLLSGRKSDAVRGANALIVFNAVRDAMSKGKNYDFEGSSIPSIATFFRSFGSEVTTFHQVYKSAYQFTDYLLKRLGKF